MIDKTKGTANDVFAWLQGMPLDCHSNRESLYKRLNNALYWHWRGDDDRREEAYGLLSRVVALAEGIDVPEDWPNEVI